MPDLVVECYAGYQGEETPRAVLLGGQRLQVVEVKHRWRTPEHRCFDVLLDDGRRLALRQDVASLVWETTRP